MEVKEISSKTIEKRKEDFLNERLKVDEEQNARIISEQLSPGAAIYYLTTKSRLDEIILYHSRTARNGFSELPLHEKQLYLTRLEPKLRKDLETATRLDNPDNSFKGLGYELANDAFEDIIEKYGHALLTKEDRLFYAFS